MPQYQCTANVPRRFRREADRRSVKNQRRYGFAFSRRDAPELLPKSTLKGGGRECRVHTAPAASCAK
jgi:hypothetical protein